MSYRKIIVNTSATYVRSVVSIALALFSGRWVFSALGPTDYGLFAVIGSIITIIAFMNGVMAGSASRHFAFAIGQGDHEEVNKWFNTSLSVHVVLPIVLTMVGWPTGEYCIRHVLTIPSDRMVSCLWVFRLSLIAAVSSMVTIPYIAMFSAKQHISEMAVWGILQTIVMFLCAFWLTKMSGDRLMIYAGYVVASGVALQVLQVARARYIFQECKINYRFWFEKCRFKRLFSFAVWTLIGSTGEVLRDQGTAILLNLNFGPNVNAAFGIANQVSSQTGQLGSAMIAAFTPEITASEGRGDRLRMLELSMRASKFGSILILLFAIPLMVEMDYILKIWLGTPPVYTGFLCQMILATFVLNRLSTGSILAINAHGKVVAYQATIGICWILTLPLVWLFFALKAPPTSAGLAFIVSMTIVTLGRAYWAQRLVGFQFQRWLREVVVPVGTVTLVSVLLAIFLRSLLKPSFSRLVIVTLVAITSTLGMTWFAALNANERDYVNRNVLKRVRRNRVG